jgi:hypothetical protein
VNRRTANRFIPLGLVAALILTGAADCKERNPTPRPNDPAPQPTINAAATKSVCDAVYARAIETLSTADMRTSMKDLAARRGVATQVKASVDAFYRAVDRASAGSVDVSRAYEGIIKACQNVGWKP